MTALLCDLCRLTLLSPPLLIFHITSRFLSLVLLRAEHLFIVFTLTATLGGHLGYDVTPTLFSCPWLTAEIP